MQGSCYVHPPAFPVRLHSLFTILIIFVHMFLTLSTLAHGRFSQNCFFIGIGGCSDSNMTVWFFPFLLAGRDQYDVLRDTLQVQYL